MAVSTVPPRTACGVLALVLNSPEIAGLIADLEATRRTGRPGYPVRALVGACLVKSLYAIPTWSRTAALIAEHDGIALALGAAPSVYACYRFVTKLSGHEDLLDRCVQKVVAAVRGRRPEFGQDLAVDASDLPAWANGQRYIRKGGPERERFSDPDASWGHRSAVSTRSAGGFYGYKLHAAVCTATDLPVAWRVETARRNEAPFAVQLVEQARSHGVPARTCAMDKAYDLGPVYDGLERIGCAPVIPLRSITKVMPEQLSLFGPNPTRVHPRIRRDSERWRSLYRRRSAIERAFGRLKHEWSMLPLRLRGRRRVALHVTLTILAQLACALLRS